jgi:hypothetical protein
VLDSPFLVLDFWRVSKELTQGQSLKPKVIVFLVGANPEPIVVTLLLTSQGTVAAANLDSVDCPFLGEAERRMPGSFALNSANCLSASF